LVLLHIRVDRPSKHPSRVSGRNNFFTSYFRSLPASAFPLARTRKDATSIPTIPMGTTVDSTTIATKLMPSLVLHALQVMIDSLYL
jgi:hypothetical protein